MIVYLSGFPFDNKVSKTHERLERILKVPVKHFQYDVTDPVGSMDLMVAKLKKLQEVEEDLFVMGSSLGGFMATVLAPKGINIRLILFNPSLFPEESLKKYVGKNVTNAKGEIVTFTEEHVKLYGKLDVSAAFHDLISPGFGAYVFVTNDPVLDSKKTAEYIKEIGWFGLIERYDLKGHRLDDEKIISIKEKLLYYYECLTVH